MKKANGMYPNRLNEVIKSQGYQKQEIAQAVGVSRNMLTHYLKGRYNVQAHVRERFASVLGVAVIDLFPTSTIPPVTTSPPYLKIDTVSQETDKEIDRLITRKQARLQNWVVDGFQDGTQLRWQLYYTSRNSLTDDGLLSQITRLEQLADDGGEHYQRVCRILAQNYQLAGSLARDRFQYTKSLEYFQKAEHLEEDVQLPDLTATAIARQAVALLRKDPEKYLNKSLTLYSSAVDKAKHAELYTQAYILSGHAEALARRGNYDKCIKSLDQAETLLSKVITVPIEEDFGYVRLTLQSLADSRGECYVLLGKPEKGLEYLQAAQKKLDYKMSRNNCRLLMQQSEAYLAAGKPDACVQQALKGLEVARILESTSNIYWANEILAKIRSSTFSKEPVVDELQEAIRDQET